MLFAFDIDNTLARDVHNVARRAFLVRILDLPASISDPALRSYLENPDHQARVQAALVASESAPDIMAALQPLPGAQYALGELASQGDIVYVTARPESLRPITVEWLTTHHFPSPERVFLCGSYQAKFLHAAEIGRAGADDQIVLVDDQAERLARAFGRIAHEQPDIALWLVPRLTLVAFNPHVSRWRMVPPPFPVLILPSWQSDWRARLLPQSVRV